MPKPSVIMSVNNKAGVDKITLASDLALFLSRNKKVLLVDCDPNGLLAKSIFFGDKIEIPESFTEEVITVSNIKENLFILQGSEQLISLTPENTKYYKSYIRLSNLLERREIDSFDYIILDSLSVFKYITISAFIAANQIIVPLFSLKLELLNIFFSRIIEILNRYDSNAIILGVLINQSNISEPEMMEKRKEIEEEYNIKVLNSYFPLNTFIQMQLDIDNEAEKLINPPELNKSTVLICKEIIEKLTMEGKV